LIETTECRYTILMIALLISLQILPDLR